MPSDKGLGIMNGIASMMSKKSPPAPKASPTSPYLDPQAAKEVEAGVNESLGDKMKRYKANLKEGLGIK